VKIDLHINGRYEIELAAESELERVMMAAMSARADKGQPISFAASKESSWPVGVDK